MCRPHCSFPGSATWFFRNCIVKSVKRCEGYAQFIQDYFTEETDGGQNGLRTFGMLMPGPREVQKREMNLDLLKRFFINNGQEFPQGFPQGDAEGDAEGDSGSLFICNT